MATRSVAELLSAQEQLAQLDAAALATLAGCARLETAAAGTMLAAEGDPADAFFVVRAGLVAIDAHGPGVTVQIDSVGPGELVGWSWIFPPHRWLFDARCIEDCRLIRVDGACIREKCERDHDFGYHLMRSFSTVVIERLESTRLRLLDLYGSSS